MARCRSRRKKMRKMTPKANIPQVGMCKYGEEKKKNVEFLG